MSKFDDILNQPLPSRKGSYTESTDDDDLYNSFFESDDDERFDDSTDESGDDEGDPSDEELASDDTEEGADCSYCEDDDYGDDFDPDDMDDDEIADSINDLDMDMDDDEFDPDDVDDEDIDGNGIPDEDEIPEPLDGEDDRKADEMMAIATTPMLIRDELTAEEAANFYESTDADIAISEGLVLESDIEDLYQEGVFASPNKPFKMTKQARFRQLYEMSVLIESRMHNDPMYTKLQKAYKIERICKKHLRKKYHNLALRRAKIYLKRLMKSKSGVLNNIGKKLGIKK